jgi:hypothetical protein
VLADHAPRRTTKRCGTTLVGVEGLDPPSSSL